MRTILLDPVGERRWRHGIASLRRQVLVEEKTKTNVGPVREHLVSIVIAVGGVFKSEELV